MNAALVVVLYWAGLCAGRVSAPLALRRRSKLVTLGVAAGLAALAVAGIASASTWNALAVSVFAAGFAVGPLAPTIIAVAGDRYPQQSGLVIGVLISVAQLGAVLLPWIAGRVAISHGFRAAMLVPFAAAIALALSAGALRVPARAPDRRADALGAGMILFDLDGTLVDTTDLILQSFVHTFDVHVPGRAPSREALIATFGRSLPATLREMAREEGAADPDAWADADAGHVQGDSSASATIR